MGLSYLNKVRLEGRMAYFYLANSKTGACLKVDPKVSRHNRKRRRISSLARYYDTLVNKGRDRSKPYDCIFVTLTYKSSKEYNKADIRGYIKRVKERLGHDLMAYAWICELQTRGVAHYHIMFIVKKGIRIEKPDKKDWKGGMSNVQRARSGVWYLISYLKKGFDQGIPKGWRCFAIYSCDGGIKLKVRIDTLPGWVINKCNEKNINLEEVYQVKKISGGWNIGGCAIMSDWEVMCDERGKIVFFDS